MGLRPISCSLSNARPLLRLSSHWNVHSKSSKTLASQMWHRHRAVYGIPHRVMPLAAIYLLFITIFPLISYFAANLYFSVSTCSRTFSCPSQRAQASHGVTVWGGFRAAILARSLPNQLPKPHAANRCTQNHLHRVRGYTVHGVRKKKLTSGHKNYPSSTVDRLSACAPLRRIRINERPQVWDVVGGKENRSDERFLFLFTSFLLYFLVLFSLSLLPLLYRAQ